MPTKLPSIDVLLVGFGWTGALMGQTGRNSRTVAYGPMSEVITFSTSKLNDDDLKAIATYLKDVPANAGAQKEDQTQPDPKTLTVGKALYVDNCSGCHQAEGQGTPGMFPRLQGDSAVQDQDPTTVVRLILNGAHAATTDARPTQVSCPPSNGSSRTSRSRTSPPTSGTRGGIPHLRFRHRKLPTCGTPSRVIWMKGGERRNDLLQTLRLAPVRRNLDGSPGSPRGDRQVQGDAGDRRLPVHARRVQAGSQDQPTHHPARAQEAQFGSRSYRTTSATAITSARASRRSRKTSNNPDIEGGPPRCMRVNWGQ